MKALVVGAGGVGESIAVAARRRDPRGMWLKKMVMADYVRARPEAVVTRLGDARFVAEQVDAGDVAAVAALAGKHGVDIICNLCAPNFNPPLLQEVLEARTHYLDTAMTLSEPHPADPMHECGVKLGDREYALNPEFESIDKYALAGFGVKPGMADDFLALLAPYEFPGGLLEMDSEYKRHRDVMSLTAPLRR